MIYIGEFDSSQQWKIAPRDQTLLADFVGTARGVVKIPNNCDCRVICHGGADYQIRCRCDWFPNIIVDIFSDGYPKSYPEDWWRTRPKSKWEVLDPRTQGFSWVYERDHYRGYREEGDELVFG